jgi:hypothetical protein
MTEFFQTDEEIEALMHAFRERTLPKSDWTHNAHLTAAIWFLRTFGLDEATCRLKSSIITYNLSVGGINDGKNGYHETLTIFWLDVAHFFVTQNPALSLKDCTNAFLSSPLVDRALPFLFYDKDELLASPARARYLAPKPGAPSFEALMQRGNGN